MKCKELHIGEYFEKYQLIVNSNNSETHLRTIASCRPIETDYYNCMIRYRYMKGHERLIMNKSRIFMV